MFNKIECISPIFIPLLEITCSNSLQGSAVWGFYSRYTNCETEHAPRGHIWRSRQGRSGTGVRPVNFVFVYVVCFFYFFFIFWWRLTKVVDLQEKQ